MSDLVIDALEDQLGCYQRLAKLAELQHVHVQQEQTDSLMEVLQRRQGVLDDIARLERVIGPAKRDWSNYVGGIAGDLRMRAESLLTQTRSLLEQITLADQNDALVLQQRKLNVGRQINQTSSAKQVNRAYATSAYGSRPGADGSFEMSTLTVNQPLQSASAANQRIEELGRIIMAYSEVTDRLQLSHDQLLSQVQNLREELSEKNRLLERKNRLAALGEMAAGMAHEIRNPLGGIQLYASLLAKDVDDRPGSRQLVDKISAGVKRLESLVSQVLHFTREINVHIVEMDLAEVVEQAVELAQHRADEKQIKLNVTGPRPLNVQADPVLIGQAILNLLLNAVEAMESAGSIEVNYGIPTEDSGARQFHLLVRDHGTGIPAHILDRIFNPFFTTKDNGTGLGLAIVHRVVEAHDGTILASNAEDGGAKIEVRI